MATPRTRTSPDSKPKPPAEGVAARTVQGAPALPAAVAKQYGLHDHAADHAIPMPPVSAETHSVMHDPATDAAVDEIAAQDGDALLAAEDAARTEAAQAVPERGFWRSIGHFFAAWWRNKWARYLTLLVLLGGAGATAAVPAARYYVLNTVGVRSSASVIALDATTRMPLKNVTVTVAGATAKTNVDGVATLHNLELGPTTLKIKRVAFAPYEVPVTIGWGSNPFGEYDMQATGVQYTLTVYDYLSGKPLRDVEAVSDQANALSDKNGKLVITVADTEATTLEATIHKQGYRTEPLTLDAEASQVARVLLVPDQKHVFVDKQKGRSDIYAMDLDGKNRQVLLAATGNETSNISLAVDADYTTVAVVSTRDGMRDADGFALSSLTLVDVRTGAAQVVDHGAQIQLLGWMDNRIVYRRGAAGASAAFAQRYRLVSYNIESQGKLQLASANQFTVSRIVGGQIYYAVSGNDPKATTGLFTIRPDGSGKERVLDQEVWTAYRNTHSTLLLQTPAEWFAYDVATKAVTKTAAPSVFGSTAYTSNRSGRLSAWVTEGQGAAALMVHDVQKGSDKQLVRQEGIAGQLRWIDDTAIIYRVSTATETADYAVSPQGGKPHKVADVTVSYGTISE